MRPRHYFELGLLAAIWGASFMFMRVLVPAVGPWGVGSIRLLLAGAVLLLGAWHLRTVFDWRQRWGQFILLGLVNSALPFMGYGYAALHMPAGYSAILNATMPFFGAAFASIWLGEPFTVRKGVGLLTGAAGVLLIVQVGLPNPDTSFYLAVAACLGAASCYAISSIYLRVRMSSVPPLASAAASQALAGLMLAPGMVLGDAPWHIDTWVVINLLLLGLVCSAFALALYFRLMSEVGPTPAMTVSFLIPMAAMLWSWCFLGEPITPTMLAGCALVLSGTGLIVRGSGR